MGVAADYEFDEQQFECPRCGEIVYFELTRCPNCGLNFYLTDQQGDWWEGEQNIADESSGWLDVSIIAILVAWLASALLAFGVHFLVAQIYGSQTLSPTARILLFFASPLSAFVGGGIVAALAERKPIFHGVAVGLFSLGEAIFLEAYWRDLSLSNILRPMTILGWGLTLVAGVLSAYLYMKRARREMVEALFFPAEHKSRRYNELYTKVGYDEDRVERLIEYERQRAPGESRKEWIERALRRWERDNR